MMGDGVHLALDMIRNICTAQRVPGGSLSVVSLGHTPWERVDRIGQVTNGWAGTCTSFAVTSGEDLAGGIIDQKLLDDGSTYDKMARGGSPFSRT